MVEDEEGKVYLLSKGADSIIISLCGPNQPYLHYTKKDLR